MKFCVDCKHYNGDEQCEAPQAYDTIDLVTGKKSRTWTLCTILRNDPDSHRVWPWGKFRASKGRCGKSAHWFEAK